MTFKSKRDEPSKSDLGFNFILILEADEIFPEVFVGGEDVIAIDEKADIVEVEIEKLVMIHHGNNLAFSIDIFIIFISIIFLLIFFLDFMQFIHDGLVVKFIVDEYFDNSGIFDVEEQILFLEMFESEEDVFDLGVVFGVFVSEESDYAFSLPLVYSFLLEEL